MVRCSVRRLAGRRFIGVSPDGGSSAAATRRCIPHSAFRVPHSAFRLPHSAFRCLAACIVLAVGIAWGAPREARADGVFALTTVLVELQLSEPEIRGNLWIDRETVEAKFPIDKNGDTVYSDEELYAVRNPLSAYIYANFFVMWDSRVQAINFTDMVYDRRGTLKRHSIKLTFTIAGYRRTRPFLMFSRMLSDLTPQPRTMVALDRGSLRTLCVLAPGTYYDTRVDEPTTTQPATASAAKSAARFACARMCLGMELSGSGRKCPRCAAPMAPVIGVPVPGKGSIGRLGGELMPLVPGFLSVEGLLARPDEFRLYLLTEELDPMPAGGMTGKAVFWTENMQQATSREVLLNTSRDGAYLYADIDPKMIKPIEARCTLYLSEGKGTRIVSFYLRGVVAEEESAPLKSP